MVALNRAVAVAEIDGPEVALALVDALDLAPFHLLHGARADLLARLGWRGEAADAYEQAILLAGNETERTFLRLRRATLLS